MAEVIEMKSKWMPLLLLLVIPIALATEQNLVYDDVDNTVKIGYDGLNRIVNKNTSSEIINYTYDEQLQGTLSNISFGNSTYKYSYDDRLRVIEEKRIIDGIEFNKKYVYDSNGRLVSIIFSTGEDFDYYYNLQGKLHRINDYINKTEYNPFGNPLNRSYFNTKLTEFEYYPDNARLKQIQTDTVQNLSYSYDFVGNIISIDDSANTRLYSMSYDDLDRLTNVSIGEYSWVYGYNAIGNVLKIIRNFSTTTSFKFDSSPAHAPQKYIVTNTSVDVYRQSLIDSSNKTKQVQFYLVNEKNETIDGINWTVNFGDGSFINSSSLSINKSKFVLITTNHTYTEGGNYKINVTSLQNLSNRDYEIVDLLFGASAKDISVLKKNATLVVTQFLAENKNNNFSTNWGWNCSNGVFSTVNFNMSSDQQLFVVMEHNYSLSSLIHNLTCEVNSTDGNQSIKTNFEFNKILIEAYNSTKKDTDTVEVKFQIANYFDTLDINWNITVDDKVFNASGISLNQGQRTSVSQEINFTNAGLKQIKVTIGSGNFTDTYQENTRLYALGVQDFLNIVKNGTTRIFNFLIQNDWYNLTMKWNITDPSLENSTSLDNNESLIVVIEEDYSQGKKQPLVQVFNSSYLEDIELDVFTIKQIGINEFQILHEEDKKAVSSALVINNIAPLNASWILDNSQDVINSTQNLELNTSESAFVVIESNFTESGIYPLNFKINSSTYNDNETGVTIS
jgi:YD repeat-containing protein